MSDLLERQRVAIDAYEATVDEALQAARRNFEDQQRTFSALKAKLAVQRANLVQMANAAEKGPANA